MGENQKTNKQARHYPTLQGPAKNLSDVEKAAIIRNSKTGQEMSFSAKEILGFCISAKSADKYNIPVDLSVLRRGSKYIQNFHGISTSLNRYAAQVGFKELNFQEDISISEKRLQTTLNRLKSKSEVYSENIPGLLINILHNTNIAFALTLACVEDIEQIIRISSEYPERCVISDSTWYKAIETVMALHEADKIDGDVQNFAALLKPYHTELMIYAFLLNFISTPELKPEADTPEAPSCEDTACNKPVSDEEARQQDDSRIKELEAEAHVLLNRLQITTDALATASNKLRKLQKESAHYQHKNKSLEEELSELRKENEFLETLLLEHAAQETLPDGEDYQAFSDVEPEDDDLDGVVLPPKNVIFLGGHVNLVNKVKAIHPDWRYINLTDNPGHHVAMLKCEMVFFWSKYISHSMDKSFFSKNNVPCVYVTATNIDKLEREMKRGYVETKRKEAANHEEGKQSKVE